MAMTTQQMTTRNHNWTATWIWSEDDGKGENLWRRFRSEFDVNPDHDPAAQPGPGTLRITADFRYQVWINDTFIGEGPPASFPHHTFVDSYEVDLQPGRNVIAVLVNHLGSWPEVTRAGLLAEVTGAAGQPLCATGPEWKVAVASEYRADTAHYWPKRVGPYQVHLDLRKVPRGWRTAGFDDSRWDQAESIGGPGARPASAFPWTKLVPRDFPHPAKQRILPEALTIVEECTALEDRFGHVGPAAELGAVGVPIDRATAKDTDALLTGGTVILQSSTAHERGCDGVRDPFITLDFGRVVTGRVQLSINGPTGAVLDLGYAERLVDGHFVNATSAPFVDRFTLAGRTERLRTHDWFGFRYLRVRLHNAFEPVTIADLAVETVRYPFEERGAFHCDKPLLNEVFTISRATIQLCCVDAIVDTPWREAAQWVGDVAAVTLGGIRACFGDVTLAQTFFRQSASTQLSRGVLPHFTNTPNTRMRPVLIDYSLWWVMSVWEHYRYSGDEQIVHELYPEVLRVIGYFAPHVTDDGLLGDLAEWVFVDWAPVETNGVGA